MPISSNNNNEEDEDEVEIDVETTTDSNNNKTENKIKNDENNLVIRRKILKKDKPVLWRPY
jgi:hypothetical protein